MNYTGQIPFNTVEQSVIDRFEYITTQFPDKEAITDGDRHFTFSELDQLANLLAGGILKSGSSAKQHALFIESGIYPFAAILGILKTGAAYIPIDTSWPAHRIESVLKDAEPGVVITNNLNLGQVKALHEENLIINIDELDDQIKVEAPASRPGPEDIIHIIYTSGSTGEPKGVYTYHRNQVHFVKRLSNFINITPDDRFAYYFSVGFSAHAMPFLSILLNGGTLCVYDLKREGFHGLGSFFKEQKITLALMIPSVLRHFRVTLDKEFRFPKLRTLLVGGETLYSNDVKLILPHLGKDTEVINIYVSTEAYLARGYRMTRETVLKQNIIPIGYEIEGMDINITNENGEVCLHNQVGEMILRSPYLALGYWKDQEQTDIHFSKEDDKVIFRSRDLAYSQEGGCIVHVGRKDSMVKIRGQRVDLGEIENSMLFNPDIQEVAVKLKESPTGGKHLLAYFVCRQGIEINEKELKTFLTRRLPDYMVPEFVIRLKELPKTESGKTNYNALPDPDWERQSKKEGIKHSRTPTEAELVSIFEQKLEMYPIGITDNILETGQDSLKMFVAFDTVEKYFNFKLDIDAITEIPTIEALARMIDEASK